MLDLLSRELNRLAEWVMALLLAALTLLVGVQIAGRFLFAYSIFWSDELARFLLVWSCISGHERRESVVGPTPPWTAWCAAYAPGRPVWPSGWPWYASLLFFLVMVGYGTLLVQRTWLQRSPSLGIRMGLPYLAVPVAGILMGLHTIAIALRGRRPTRRAGGLDG